MSEREEIARLVELLKVMPDLKSGVTATTSILTERWVAVAKGNGDTWALHLEAFEKLCWHFAAALSAAPSPVDGGEGSEDDLIVRPAAPHAAQGPDYTVKQRSFTVGNGGMIRQSVSAPESAVGGAEPSAEVWLRDVGGICPSDGQWDECWVPCSKGDPGARLFVYSGERS